MNIIKNTDNTTLTMGIEGRLDTTTAPELEKELKISEEGINNLVLDLEKLDYISSAGLRVILAAQKTMNAKKNGHMIVKNVNETVMEVFDVTGFVDILTFE